MTPSQIGNPPSTETREPQPGAAVAARAGRPGILVADDKEYMRRLLDVGLRQQGYAVWLAADGWEALELYRLHHAAIDVVLLDVRMPGLDGPATLAALRQVNPEVRCCFMSGDLDRDTEGRSHLGNSVSVGTEFRRSGWDSQP